MRNKKPATIRDQNDRFRKGDRTIPGEIYITRGLMSLLEEHNRDPSELVHLVRNYEKFTPDSDPHGEHDFGAFEYLGYPCFWKLALYDPTLKWVSEDPADPTKTMRVLTILLTEEY